LELASITVKQKEKVKDRLLDRLLFEGLDVKDRTVRLPPLQP
jgi:hypothetical protein